MKKSPPPKVKHGLLPKLYPLTAPAAGAGCQGTKVLGPGNFSYCYPKWWWDRSCPFPLPCPHLVESTGLFSPPPGECCLGPSPARATLLCISLCVYVGGLSPSAGVCVGSWVVTLQGVTAHVRACVCQRGYRGVCAAHVLTDDACGFTCSGEKPLPTSLP